MAGPPPLVSVVLPTYQRAATLERAVDSVLRQTLDDFELIIVDDTSTDDTPRILCRYARSPKVRVLSQPRRGCAVARNIGVRAARGRYVAFQDSDDEWAAHKLATAVAALEGTGPDTGVFYSDMLRIHRDGRRADFRAPAVRPGVLVDERTLDYQVYGIGIQSALIKRACFDTAGDFDEALPRFIDLDLFIRLSDRFRFVHCAQMLVHYHDVDGISTDRRARVVARRHLLRKYRSRLRRHPHHLARQYVLLARALEDTGHTGRALLCHLRALRALPHDAGIRHEARQVVHRLKHEVLARYPLAP